MLPILPQKMIGFVLICKSVSHQKQNNHKNCMHGIRNSKDNKLVEGRQGVEKTSVQTLNVEMSVKQWFLLKKRLTFLILMKFNQTGSSYHTYHKFSKYKKLA